MKLEWYEDESGLVVDPNTLEKPSNVVMSGPVDCPQCKVKAAVLITAWLKGLAITEAKCVCGMNFVYKKVICRDIFRDRNWMMSFVNTSKYQMARCLGDSKVWMLEEKERAEAEQARQIEALKKQVALTLLDEAVEEGQRAANEIIKNPRKNLNVGTTYSGDVIAEQPGIITNMEREESKSARVGGDASKPFYRMLDWLRVAFTLLIVLIITWGICLVMYVGQHLLSKPETGEIHSSLTQTLRG